MHWLLLLSLLGVVASAGLSPVATTPYGKVRGFTVDSQGVPFQKVWRGIRYAAPPLEDLRFRPPQPPQPWSTTINTTDFGASCLQWGAPGTRHGGGWPSLNLTNSSEDCLFVNVYAPVQAEGSAALPVMVYLHAGEFNFGSSNDAENNFPYFANGSVILVTANVRLGYFGFAALEEFRSRDPAGSSGNYGMQDQRAVMKWVKQSIAEFGGDAEKITIFGESSGGSSVAFHLINNRSRGLYSKAIMESPGLTQSKPWSDVVENTKFVASVLTAAGSPGCSWPQKTEWMHFKGLKTGGTALGAVPKNSSLEACAAMANCSVVWMQHSSSDAVLYGGGKPGGLSNGIVFQNETLKLGKDPGMDVFVKVSNPETVVDCLVKASPYDLASEAGLPPHSDTFRTDSAAPTVDGVELTGALEDLAISDVPGDIPLLAGANLDEGTEFMYLVPHIACNATADELSKWAVAQFGAELGAKIPSAYHTVEQPTPLCRNYHHSSNATTTMQWVAAMRSAGDGAILCRARQMLKSSQQKGNTVWWYFFTHTPIKTLNFPDTRYEGAFHGGEVPFVFGDGFELSSDAERALSKAMGCYWINFAATGNPNEGPSNCAAELSLHKWPVFGEGDAIELSTEQIRDRPGLKRDQCDMFAKAHQPSWQDIFVI